ncbi:TPA: TVP38/TMEM64 family protein [Streptococcus suis]
MKLNRIEYRQVHTFLTGLGIVSLLLAIIYLMSRYGTSILAFGQKHLSLAELETIFSKPSLLDFVILLLLTSLTAAIPFLSSSLLAICNGVVFGPWLGFIMNLAANCLGNFLMIQVIQSLDSHRKPRTNSYLERLKQLKNQNVALILAYMIPLFPTLVVNYWVASQKLSWKKWVVIVLGGTAPTSLLYTFGGQAILDENPTFLLGLAVLILIALFAYLIWHHTHKEKN